MKSTYCAYSMVLTIFTPSAESSLVLGYKHEMSTMVVRSSIKYHMKDN